MGKTVYRRVMILCITLIKIVLYWSGVLICHVKSWTCYTKPQGWGWQAMYEPSPWSGELIHWRNYNSHILIVDFLFHP